MLISLTLFATLLCTASAVTTSWTRCFDNLSDYEVISSHSAASGVQCTALASRLSGVQLVTYNSRTGVCRVYKCRLSLPDCRKCRNLNSANQQVLIQSSNAATCWTTVQHRVSNSVDFYRNWAAYKAGFGEGPNGNFWIGLNSLHSLTSVIGGRKLRFLMKAWNGSESWAQYSSFSVGPESDGFRLSVSGFSSSHPAINDSFGATSGYKFTTVDVDNDAWTGNCANRFGGCWWFNACSNMRFNGVFFNYPTAINVPYGEGLIWGDGYGFEYSLMEVEMLIL